MSAIDWMSENLLGNDKRYPGARTKAGNSVVEEGLRALDGAINSALGIPAEMNFATGPYGLTKLPRRFYLEVRKGGKILTVSSFPYDPDAFIYNRDNPVAVTHTLGGVVREHGTIRSHMLKFSGRSGTAVRAGYNRDGYQIFRTGQVIFKEFDEFLKKYIEDAAHDYGNSETMSIAYGDVQRNGVGGPTSLQQSARYEMILRCLDDDLHLKVEPVNFSYNRVANRNRHDYQFELELEAYDYAYDTAPFFPVEELNNILENTVGQITGAVALYDNAVNNIANDYVGGLAKSVQILGRPLQSIQQAKRSHKLLQASINNLKKTWDQTDIIRSGTSESPQSRNQREEAAAGARVDVSWNTQITPEVADIILAQNRQALDYPRTDSDVEEDVTAAAIASQIQFENALAIAMGGVPRDLIQRLELSQRPYVLGEWLSNEPNLGLLNNDPLDDLLIIEPDVPEDAVPYRCQRNEDLKKISKKFFGTHDRWPTIAQLNGMPDSRRKKDGGILDYGDIVFIPREGILAINTFAQQGDIFSVDISMPYDDLELIGQGKNDFEIISEIENLKQGVKNKLLTYKGEMPGFEEVGLPRLSFINDVDYTSSQIREVLIKDPRIADVNSIYAEVEDDTVRISVNVVPLSGDSFNVRI